MDYAADSALWLHASDGLNLQAVHHLFPQVAWGHYTALAPIIHCVCRAHGVRYSTVPTFWDALRRHLGYLSDINEGAYASVWLPDAHRNGRAPEAALVTLGQATCKPKKRKNKN
jgi:hypothetical protein